MIITLRHVVNAGLWVALMMFMVIQSIQHTIQDHHKGVVQAIQHYAIQSQSRVALLTDIMDDTGIRGMEETALMSQLLAIKNETNPYQLIQLNDDMTHYIDHHMAQFGWSKSQQQALQTAQQHVVEESVIYNAHAALFNALIQRVPYAIFSEEYTPLLVTNRHDTGIVVE